MGWDQKDAVGELLKEGDRVKVFRNFGKDKECDCIVGVVGVVRLVELPYYNGRLHVQVHFSEGFNLWVHHMSVMKV